MNCCNFLHFSLVTVLIGRRVIGDVVNEYHFCKKKTSYGHQVWGMLSSGQWMSESESVHSIRFEVGGYLGTANTGVIMRNPSEFFSLENF